MCPATLGQKKMAVVDKSQCTDCLPKEVAAVKRAERGGRSSGFDFITNFDNLFFYKTPWTARAMIALDGQLLYTIATIFFMRKCDTINYICDSYITQCDDYRKLRKYMISLIQILLSFISSS